MKKLMILCVLLILSLTACNCGGTQETTNTTNDTTTTKAIQTEESTSSISHTLPTVIVLEDSYRKETKIFLGYDPLYRECYYKFGGFIFGLVENEKSQEFVRVFEKENPPKSEKKEMLVKAFVEYFDIPKEKFEEAVQKQISFCLENEMDISLEEYEIPNPDIIYTFDDAIINDYYRRDKGVKPTETQSSVTE